MNFIIDLLLLSEYDAIYVIVNRLIKKRHYVIYTINNNETLVTALIDIIIL